MIKSLPTLTALLSLAMLVASCKHNEPVELKLNLQPGSQYTYTIETNTTTEQQPMGQKITSTQNVTMEMTYSAGAREANGGDQRITVTYDRLAMDLKSPLASMSYDSREPSQGSSQLSVVANMLHKPFTMDVSPQGEITRVQGLDSILRGVGDTTSPEGIAIHQQMAETFNDTAVRSLMRQSLDIFPGHPVKPGDTWTKTYSMDMNVMRMKVENQFMLKDVEGGTAHLDIKAKISGDGTANLPERRSMSIELNGEQTGTMNVDIASGLVTEGNVKWHIAGSMSVMGIKVPVSIDAVVHITAKKK